MRQHIGGQAHPPQHEEDAERRRRHRQRQAAHQRPPEEAEFDERVEQGQAAQASACSSQASAIIRARSRLAAVSTSPVGPQPRQSRASSRVSGNSRRHQLQVVQHRDHGPALAMPAMHHGQQRHRRPGIERVEGLVQQDHRRILQQQPGEHHPLELPGREAADRPRLEALQPDRRQRLGRLGPPGAADGTERPALAPEAEQHDIEAAQREAAVQHRLLRQQGHLPGGALDPAMLRPVQPGECPQQGGLARPVRPDDGGQAARREAAGDVVHRRPPLMADGEVGEGDRGRRHHAAIAQATPAQSAVATTAASTRRAAAPEDRSSGSGKGQDMML